MDHINGALALILIVFLIVLAILWFCLPFAIFGTKDLIQKLIDENIKTRAAIEDLAESIKGLENKWIKKKYNQDPDYLQGQIDALKHVLLALAAITTSKAEFRISASRHLENLKTAAIYSKYNDTHLKGIDDVAAFFQTVTSDD